MTKIEDFQFSFSPGESNYHCTSPMCIAIVSSDLNRNFGIDRMIVRSNIVQMGCNYPKSSLELNLARDSVSEAFDVPSNHLCFSFPLIKTLDERKRIEQFTTYAVSVSGPCSD